MPTFVIVRLDRTIQYSETPAMESRTRGILDPPVKPGDDGGGWNIVIVVIARSACDEAIQLFLIVLDCFANARNDGRSAV
jgi:hypothetical protein